MRFNSERKKKKRFCIADAPHSGDVRCRDVPPFKNSSMACFLSRRLESPCSANHKRPCQPTNHNNPMTPLAVTKTSGTFHRGFNKLYSKYTGQPALSFLCCQYLYKVYWYFYRKCQTMLGVVVSPQLDTQVAECWLLPSEQTVGSPWFLDPSLLIDRQGLYSAASGDQKQRSYQRRLMRLVGAGVWGGNTTYKPRHDHYRQTFQSKIPPTVPGTTFFNANYNTHQNVNHLHEKSTTITSLPQSP